MIRMAAENAHAEGKWIGICGELGADLELTEEFLSMGLDELSYPLQWYFRSERRSGKPNKIYSQIL